MGLQAVFSPMYHAWLCLQPAVPRTRSASAHGVRTAIAPSAPDPWRQNQLTLLEAHTQVVTHITCSVVGDKMPSAAKIGAEGTTGPGSPTGKVPAEFELASRGSGQSARSSRILLGRLTKVTGPEPAPLRKATTICQAAIDDLTVGICQRKRPTGETTAPLPRRP